MLDSDVVDQGCYFLWPTLCDNNNSARSALWEMEALLGISYIYTIFCGGLYVS